jgi:alpha-L-fucosidase 2
MSEHILSYNAPSLRWEKGFPIGNGRMGAVVYGSADKTVIALNEDTLWSGYPDPDDSFNGIDREDIDHTRNLTKQGKYVEAMRFLEDKMKECRDVAMYEPFCHVVVEEEKNMAVIGSKQSDHFSRQLDLSRAVVTAQHGPDSYEEAFASYPAQCIVYSADFETPRNLRIFGEEGCLVSQSAGAYEGDRRVDVLILDGECPGRNHLTVGTTPNHTKPIRANEPEKRGIRCQGRILIYSDGRSSWNAPDEINNQPAFFRIENASRLELRIFIRTSFNGPDRHPFLDRADYKAELDEDIRKFGGRSKEELREEHIRDYQKYFDRVRFEINAESPEDSMFPILFDLGRYLIISGSRPGTQAMNLQGIWNDDVTPPWFSDYTTNINVEMNYWLCGPCSLPEMEMPLADLVRDLTVPGENTAREIYGSGGTCCFHNTDLWRKTSPANGRAMWAYWPLGSAWMCRNLFDEYLYSEDENYLKAIFPALMDNAEFILDSLKETENGKYLVLSPMTSPENEFLYPDENGEKIHCSIAEYTENGNAIARNLLHDFIDACRILDPDNRLLSKAVSALSRIMPVKIGSEGQILEWNSEFEEADIHHRHTSQLYEIYPGRGINDDTPELEKAVGTSLLRRGFTNRDGGWNIPWRAAMWGRLGEADKARKLLLSYIDYEGGPENRYYPSNPLFQIDAVLGFPAAVSMMLIDSRKIGDSHLLADKDRQAVGCRTGVTADGAEPVCSEPDGILLIHLLPALPAEWESGSVEGIAAHGGITADITWTKSRIDYRIHSGKQRRICLQIENRPAFTAEFHPVSAGQDAGRNGYEIKGCVERT